MADLVRAVEYVRMSTAGQQLSIPFQQAAIRLHAVQRGYEIVRTYADEARSGLYLEGRPSLASLLAEVESGCADFRAILVYDVSRWGRFQDVDESGYYEYLCRKAGISVEYCAELFGIDPSPLNAVLKAIKRAMAAEYSRELSVKTFAAMSRVVTQGYLPGGMPGYGMRRMVVSNGMPKEILDDGVRKGIKTDRIVLVPGPDCEVATIRRIYRLFLRERMSLQAISSLLESDRIPGPGGRHWTPHNVRTILHNERYAGIIVYNRTSSALRKGFMRPGRMRNDPSQWIRGNLPQRIVQYEDLARVKALPNLRGLVYRDEEEILGPLRKILAKTGYLSANLLKRHPELPSTSTCRHRFGNLRAVYERLGYRRIWHHERQVANRQKAREVMLKIADAAEAVGHKVRWDWRRRVMTFDTGVTFTVSVAWYKPRTRYKPVDRWEAYTKHSTNPAFVVVPRLDRSADQVSDYFCLPAMQIRTIKTVFDERHNYSQFWCPSLTHVVDRLLNPTPVAEYSEAAATRWRLRTEPRSRHSKPKHS